MESKYAIRQKAEEDLDSILSYIAADNPKAALNLYNTFLNKFENIATFPEMGHLRKEFTPPMRSLATGNYVIFFTSKNPVEIIRVLHGARGFTDDIEQFE